MELAALVAETLLASAESTEVLRSLWDYIVEEVEVDAATLSYRRIIMSVNVHKTVCGGSAEHYWMYNHAQSSFESLDTQGTVVYETRVKRLTRRNIAAGSFSIRSSFVELSVGVFDVKPGFDGHVCG